MTIAPTTQADLGRTVVAHHQQRLDATWHQRDDVLDPLLAHLPILYLPALGKGVSRCVRRHYLSTLAFRGREYVRTKKKGRIVREWRLVSRRLKERRLRASRVNPMNGPPRRRYREEDPIIVFIV